jgi:hypothetical protein
MFLPAGQDTGPSQISANGGAAQTAAITTATATATRSAVQAQTNQMLSEFQRQSRQERQPMMALLQELSFKLDRLPIDIRDAITSNSQ